MAAIEVTVESTLGLSEGRLYVIVRQTEPIGSRVDRCRRFDRSAQRWKLLQRSAGTAAKDESIDGTPCEGMDSRMFRLGIA